MFEWTSTALFIWLFHISNLMAFLAFLLRDQMQLRILMAVSLFLQGLYYFAIPGGPLLDPLFWKVVSFVANLAMIVLVFSGKLDFGIPEDARLLFNKIHVLSPGQFRKLLSASHRTQANGGELLTENSKPENLHFLVRGTAEIAKSGHRSVIPSGAFLGEIAFLNQSVASATVRLNDDAECISWRHDKLRALIAKDKAIDIAMRGVFNADLAAKVASSMPVQRVES
jgi:hypothetical protein